MKALVRHKYGGPGVVRVEEVEQPALEDDRVLVRVHASSLNKADWHQLRGWPRFLRPVTRDGVLRPKSALFGTDFAGVVEAVGKDVTDLAPGDEVFGGRSGAFAEYVSATNVVRKPPNVTFEEAATMGIAGLTALQGLRDHGEAPAGRAGADQRRLGRRRDARRPDREGARRPRHRGVQHAQRRADARARRRPRARLHPRGLHRGDGALRPDRRRRRRPLVARDSASPRAGRSARDRRSARQPKSAGAHRRRLARVALRQADRQVLRRELQQARPPDARRHCSRAAP